jgi:hypothetical protein
MMHEAWINCNIKEAGQTFRIDLAGLKPSAAQVLIQLPQQGLNRN